MSVSSVSDKCNRDKAGAGCGCPCDTGSERGSQGRGLCPPEPKTPTPGVFSGDRKGRAYDGFASATSRIALMSSLTSRSVGAVPG